MCIVSEVKGQISTQHRTAPHQTTLQPPSLPLPLYKRERKGMGGKRKEGVLALLAYVSAKPAVVWDTEHAACTNISPVLLDIPIYVYDTVCRLSTEPI